jgi:hypothetical protein
MVRVACLIFTAVAMCAQTAPEAAPKASPEVDAALRARVTQFYQLEIAGKFHQAEQLVAEDTKDLFVGSSKPTYYAFELQSIKYADDFTKADVVVLMSRQMPVEGFLGHAVKSKLPSRWKLENGLWCWYIDPQRDLPSSPFHAATPMPPGMPVPTATAMPPGIPVPAGGLPGAAPGAMPPMPPGMPVPTGGTSGTPRPLPPMPVIAPIQMTMSVDKLKVELKSAGPSSGQVSIANPSPLPAALTINDPKVEGLTVKLDRFTIQPRQAATLSIQWNGKQNPKHPVMIVVKVPRINQVIPITVTFKD